MLFAIHVLRTSNLCFSSQGLTAASKVIVSEPGLLPLPFDLSIATSFSRASSLPKNSVPFLCQWYVQPMYPSRLRRLDTSARMPICTIFATIS
jgi:hypothetical protein